MQENEDIWKGNHYFKKNGTKIDLLQPSIIFQCQKEDCEYVFTYLTRDAAEIGKRMHNYAAHSETLVPEAVAKSRDNTEQHYRGFRSRVEMIELDQLK